MCRIPVPLFFLSLSVFLVCGLETACGKETFWPQPSFLGQTVPPESASLTCASKAVESDGYPPLMLQQQQHAKPWQLQIFPDGHIFPAYLAGVNESRLGCVWNKDDDRGWIWDITLGGQAPLLRYGNTDKILPEGFQFDIEGSVHLRLDIEHERDMDAGDYHFGLPISYGTKMWQFKTGYYHVSSHLGDERMLRLKELGYDAPYGRTNYVREAWIFGVAFRPHQDIRLYAEADLAFWKGEGTNQWHFQFGAEYCPIYPDAGGWHGRPFFAIHTRLMEERNYDGNLNIQCGWMWRGSRNQIFRLGLQYFTGISEQFEYMYTKRENKLGLGMWYDF